MGEQKVTHRFVELAHIQKEINYASVHCVKSLRWKRIRNRLEHLLSNSPLGNDGWERCLIDQMHLKELHSKV
jgi:hypothetical protein